MCRFQINSPGAHGRLPAAVAEQSSGQQKLAQEVHKNINKNAWKNSEKSWLLSLHHTPHISKEVHKGAEFPISSGRGCVLAQLVPGEAPGLQSLSSLLGSSPVSYMVLPSRLLQM